jgi:hypothetical protein
VTSDAGRRSSIAAPRAFRLSVIHVTAPVRRTRHGAALALSVLMTLVRLRLAAGFALVALVAATPAFAQRRPAPRHRRPAATSTRMTATRWADSVSRTIDAATRAGGMARLEAARRVVTRALAAFPDDALLLHYDGFLLYRMVTVGGTSLPAALTAAYLDDARAALERSLARRPMAESYLLVSEIYGRQIAATPSRGATLGPNMELARARAMATGASNPRVFLLAGIAALYADSAAGGGVHAAERLLRASLDLFAHDAAKTPAPTWGHAEAYAWLGQVFERTGRRAQARAAYAKALALEPDNAWVRDVLVPGVKTGK